MRSPLISPQRSVRPPSERGPRGANEAANLKGAGLMALAMIGFAVNDAAMKQVFQTLPLYEAIFIRGLIIMAVLPLIFRRRGGLDLRVGRRDWRALALRTGGEIASTLLFLNALHHLPISELSAIMQALPLLVMVAAAALFGERLGWRRLGAVGVGIIGVMLILRPGSLSFTVWSVVALGSVLGVVLRDLATRMFTPAVRSNTIAFYAALSVTLTALLMPSEPWVIPDARQTLGLGTAGAALTLGYLTVVGSMRVGEVGFVAPFRYVSLVASVILGLVLFGERPDLWMALGSTLVVGAGLYCIWRERRGGA